MATLEIIADQSTVIYGINSNISTARVLPSGFRSEPVDTIGQHKISTNYYIWRGLLRFNTLVIGNREISQVNLRMVCTANSALTGFEVRIGTLDWSAYDPIVSGNMGDAYNAIHSSPQDDSILGDNGDFFADTPVTSGNLNIPHINKSGYTYFCLHSSRDWEYHDATPTQNESSNFGFVSNATASYRPTLIIEYIPSTNIAATYLSDYGMA